MGLGVLFKKPLFKMADPSQDIFYTTSAHPVVWTVQSISWYSPLGRPIFAPGGKIAALFKEELDTKYKLQEQHHLR